MEEMEDPWLEKSEPEYHPQLTFLKEIFPLFFKEVFLYIESHLRRNSSSLSLLSSPSTISQPSPLPTLSINQSPLSTLSPPLPFPNNSNSLLKERRGERVKPFQWVSPSSLQEEEVGGGFGVGEEEQHLLSPPPPLREGREESGELSGELSGGLGGGLGGEGGGGKVVDWRKVREVGEKLMGGVFPLEMREEEEKGSVIIFHNKALHSSSPQNTPPSSHSSFSSFNFPSLPPPSHSSPSSHSSHSSFSNFSHLTLPLHSHPSLHLKSNDSHLSQPLLNTQEEEGVESGTLKEKEASKEEGGIEKREKEGKKEEGEGGEEIGEEGMTGTTLGGEKYKLEVSKMSVENECVAIVQYSLFRIGYYNLPIDGIHGEATRNALLSFQSRNSFSTHSPSFSSFSSLLLFFLKKYF